MRYFYIIFAFFFSFLNLSCNSNTDDNEIVDSPTNVLDALTMLDVSYGDHEQQVYDLYLPEGRTSNATKTIILIHGGSWTGGDKENINELIPLVQSTHPDHAVVNMNYVLAQPPVVPAFPNQFLDVQLAIQTLKENSQSLAITEEFGLVGSSAGAHIAMMYDYQYDTNDDVKFVANIVGPSDFTDPNYSQIVDIDTAINGFVDENAYPENTNFIEALSPAFAVSNNSSPTLLFYGNQDPIVPLSNGQRLEVELENSNIPHLFTVYDGGHGDWDVMSYFDVQSKIGAYIDQYLPID